MEPVFAKRPELLPVMVRGLAGNLCMCMDRLARTDKQSGTQTSCNIVRGHHTSEQRAFLDIPQLN